MSINAWRSRLSQVLLAPIITEKTTNSGDKENSVAFWVMPSANKLEIKRAVEYFFPEVKVVNVRTSIKGRDTVTRGKVSGRKAKKKKAFVKLQKGHEINFAEFEKV